MSYVPPPTPNTAQAYGPVPNYLAWAIISTVLATCLCCPLGLVGIVAIVFAAKVNGLLAAGDIDGARRASANAKTWCWVATALAIIGLLLNIYMYSSGGMAEYQQWIEQMQQAQ
ncbi:CD225/dispanin family protein [Pseudoxanthomonas suwonensis]|jgi:Interferon-induced transmembrane protein.|uniref:CD225/dispanin family protein n=1 Tax=Pseudoxanthomonas suwonensis TaxID=314722 RepID=UPI000463E2F3|nr:CD225/dispanin family protein [Pseudoxanthomonas suwonensis]